MGQEERRYFNSIKVRLKPPARLRWCVCAHPFQFHKGTIKTERIAAALNVEPISIP